MTPTIDTTSPARKDDPGLAAAAPPRVPRPRTRCPGVTRDARVREHPRRGACRPSLADCPLRGARARPADRPRLFLPSTSSQSKKANDSGSISALMRSSEKVVPTAQSSWQPLGGRKSSRRCARSSALSVRKLQSVKNIFQQPLTNAPPEVQLGGAEVAATAPWARGLSMRARFFFNRRSRSRINNRAVWSSHRREVSLTNTRFHHVLIKSRVGLVIRGLAPKISSPKALTLPRCKNVMTCRDRVRPLCEAFAVARASILPLCLLSKSNCKVTARHA